MQNRGQPIFFESKSGLSSFGGYTEGRRIYAFPVVGKNSPLVYVNVKYNLKLVAQVVDIL